MPCAERERLEVTWTSTLKRLQEQKSVNRTSGIADSIRGREVISRLETEHQDAANRLTVHRDTCHTCRKSAGLE